MPRQKCPRENSLYKKIAKHLPGKVDRIENGAASGMADFTFTYRDRACWLEVKVHKAKRHVDMQELLLPSQRAWTCAMLTIGRASRVYGLVYYWKKDEWNLFRAVGKEKLDEFRVKIVYSLLYSGELSGIREVFEKGE